MPAKTVYVSKEGIEIFETAKKRAGTIENALAQYLGREREKDVAKAEGFSEVYVTLGSPGYEHEKRFFGKRLLSTFDGRDRNNWRGFTIYETRKGQYVVVSCSLPDPWTLQTGTSEPLQQAIALDESMESVNRAGDILFGYGDGNFTEYATSYSMTICPKLDDVAKALPSHVFGNLKDRLEQIKNPIEYLDI
jgi:EXLDI family protein